MTEAVRREGAIVGIAVLVAMAVGSLLILVYGESPAAVYRLILGATWSNEHDIGQVLFKTTPLILTGLSVALAFRAGLFNIGAEGQLVLGAFATGLAGAALPIDTPWPVAIPLALAAGAAAGALWGAIPGALKAWTGAHEVINTIMMNFIAFSLVRWAGKGWFFLPETEHTRRVVDGAFMPGLGLAGSAANLSFVLALGCAGLVWYFLARTRRGYELSALGLAPLAAEAGGVDRKRAVILAMTGAGLLAGLVGANQVLGYKHYYEFGMGSGAGFMGIAVALLGRTHPAGVVVAALLVGTLQHGGLAASELVPRELIDVLLAIIILSVAASSAEVRRLISREARPR